MSLFVASSINRTLIHLLATTVVVRLQPTDDVNILYLSVIPATLLWTVYGCCIKTTSIPSFSVNSIGLSVAVLECCKFIWWHWLIVCGFGFHCSPTFDYLLTFAILIVGVLFVLH